ncbi:uncharacterized protein DS421_20g695880 [Arachis hypogaea]|nr:uncharacterized protein DS421_20g695880 [Arachis hypogaea]
MGHTPRAELGSWQELWPRALVPFLAKVCAHSFLVKKEQSSSQELESSWQELYLSLRSMVQVLGEALASHFPWHKSSA